MNYKKMIYYDWDQRWRLRKLVIEYWSEEGNILYRSRMFMPLFLGVLKRKLKRRCARIEKRLELMK